ncbi:hypothetical protein JTE90_004260 [Oedothorax gibbosus]|uniref:Carboxylesterase type B domain-containing protein n=1 Tax=Oedothorax gibbosus TaxID=931172 RepID=A0AAV6UEP9_9ARAC|nr:hypothetical protein JTE90_004260 [Oedothorax gibbosus]
MMMGQISLIALWIAVFLTHGSADNGKTEVNTPLGKIIGKTVDFNGISVKTYQGISFVKPPVGDLRFKKPQPVEPWGDVPFVADHLPPGCVQYSSNPFPWLDDLPGQSLDCLYLNVWAPADAGPSCQKPVMFFMHGGGFRIGSSRLDYYDGRTLAALGDVVVVTTNVRLGVEGFLYAGTEDAPGNMGLYDLLEALKWTNTYIENFGGNRDSITYFGQSSGAIAGGMLMTSPLARNLFARAIFQSGSTANLDGEVNDRDFELSQGVAKAVNCTPGEQTLSNDPEKVIACLRGKDALELAKTVGRVSDNPQRGLYPRFDDEILPTNARQQIIQGNFTNIDILIGNNKDEGSTMITKANKEIFGFFGDKTDRVNKSLGEQLVRSSFKGFRGVDAVVEHYLGSVIEDDEKEVLQQVLTASGDYARLCPCTYLADSVAANGNRVYYYQFTHRPTPTPWAPWMGVVHFDETPFVFGYPLRYPENYSEDERDLSRRMIAIWTGFAKNGTLKNWPLYSRSNPNYRTFDTNDENFGTGPHLDNCNFFRSYFGFL